MYLDSQKPGTGLGGGAGTAQRLARLPSGIRTLVIYHSINTSTDLPKERKKYSSSCETMDQLIEDPTLHPKYSRKTGKIATRRRKRKVSPAGLDGTTTQARAIEVPECMLYISRFLKDYLLAWTATPARRRESVLPCNSLDRPRRNMCPGQVQSVQASPGRATRSILPHISYCNRQSIYVGIQE